MNKNKRNVQSTRQSNRYNQGDGGNNYDQNHSTMASFNNVPSVNQRLQNVAGMNPYSNPPYQQTNLKSEPIIDATPITEIEEEKISPFKKFFTNKKKGGVTRRRERKARQNRRLRKMLSPKTALMALNELKGNLSQYNVTGQGTSFTAEIFVNDTRYEGYRNSKIAAKNNASEKALRELIINKMSKIPKKNVEIIHGKSQVDNVPEGEDVEMKNENEDEEDVPMIHLASFALHKLFSEWESQGFQIPDFRYGGGPTGSAEDLTNIDDGEKKQPRKPQPRSEVPPNANSMHPCMLLSFMRPGVQYADLGCDGTPPNATHKIGITLDDQVYIGEGKSKKIARKMVAIDVCNALYGTTFTKDDQARNGAVQS